MKELVGDVGRRAIVDQAPPDQQHFGEINEQMNQREPGNHNMRPKGKERARDKKAREDDGAQIVNQPVQQIGARLPAAFLFDEVVRLKNKIGQEVRQVDGEKRSEEYLHNFVQFPGFVYFRTTNAVSEKYAR